MQNTIESYAQIRKMAIEFNKQMSKATGKWYWEIIIDSGGDYKDCFDNIEAIFNEWSHDMFSKAKR